MQIKLWPSLELKLRKPCDGTKMIALKKQNEIICFMEEKHYRQSSQFFIVTGLFILMGGVGLSIYLGFRDYGWYGFLPASLVLTTGYFFFRFNPTVYNLYFTQGAFGIAKLFVQQMIITSLVSAPLYFITAYFVDLF